MNEFKLPCPVRKKAFEDVFDFPIFSFDEVVFKEQVGRGSFGTVDKAIFKPKTGEPARVVVIKQPYDIQGQEREFLKEARLLDRVSKHKNVVSFYGICRKPFAIMQEYVCFSFAPFGGESVVSTLSQLLSHIDMDYDFKGFEHLPLTIMNDLVAALAYLHEQDVVHRDLKPANVLVSNQHMISGKDQESFLRQWKVGKSPIICKVTDFGESRSKMVQTQSILTSRVTSLNRGTPAYMAPEIILQERRPAYATMDDLKAAYIWALGMILFAVVNPSLPYPYSTEIDEELLASPTLDPRQKLEELLRNEQRPRCAHKYKHMHASKWWVIAELYERLTNTDVSKRVRTTAAIQNEIEKLQSNCSCAVRNLSVSQGSALERKHCEMAKQIATGTQHRVQSRRKILKNYSIEQFLYCFTCNILYHDSNQLISSVSCNVRLITR